MGVIAVKKIALAFLFLVFAFSISVCAETQILHIYEGNPLPKTFVEDEITLMDSKWEEFERNLKKLWDKIDENEYLDVSNLNVTVDDFFNNYYCRFCIKIRWSIIM